VSKEGKFQRNGRQLTQGVTSGAHQVTVHDHSRDDAHTDEMMVVIANIPDVAQTPVKPNDNLQQRKDNPPLLPMSATHFLGEQS